MASLGSSLESMELNFVIPTMYAPASINLWIVSAVPEAGGQVSANARLQSEFGNPFMLNASLTAIRTPCNGRFSVSAREGTAMLSGWKRSPRNDSV